MQTSIHPDLLPLADVGEANDILRSCVHCGFCTATCPTYQVTFDELEGPRGRIYLIKNLLEDNTISAPAVEHLDHCLTCRACETTCPSGVEYGRLLDIGRELARERRPARPLRALLVRALSGLLQQPRFFGVLYQLGQQVRGLLPSLLRTKIMPRGRRIAAVTMTDVRPAREVLVLQGCAQRATTPDVNRALAQLLSRHGVVVRHLAAEGCCGALDFHTDNQDAGRSRMRRMIERLEASSYADLPVVSTASGCGVTVKDYPALLAQDADYAQRAENVAGRVQDAVELLDAYEFRCRGLRVAVHDPCTLQHGQKLPGAVANLLRRAGAEIVPVADAHLCCGSAGAYSVLQPAMAAELRSRKLAALTHQAPEVIVTANVGCQLHLGGSAEVPVMHWLEFLYHYAD